MYLDISENNNFQLNVSYFFVYMDGWESKGWKYLGQSMYYYRRFFPVPLHLPLETWLFRFDRQTSVFFLDKSFSTTQKMQKAKP